MIKLTIGMPTYYDYKGMMLTVMDLVEHHLTDEIEILVVDNTQEDKFAKIQENQIKQINKPNVNYVRFPEQRGPAETKNKVFENAKGEFVLCIDSHIILEKGLVKKLLEFLDKLTDEDKLNLYGGPLKQNSGNVSTHFDNVWRNQMQGIWTKDEEFMEQDQPKEFWGSGCGFFLAKRDEWLGFNPNFNGFGGEEGYIHEKYRKNGRKFLVIPWAKWWHCFDDPTQKRSDLSIYSKIRNYVLSRLEFGEPLDDVYNHFVSTLKPNGQEYSRQELLKHLVEEHSVSFPRLSDLPMKTLREVHKQRKLPQEDWDWLLEDPVGRVDPKPNPILDVFTENMKNEANDLKSHFPALKAYAEKSNTVFDVSRRNLSSLGLLAGKPKVIHTYIYETRPIDWSKLIDESQDDIEYTLNNKGTFDSLRDDVMSLPEDRKADFIFFKPPHDTDNLEEFILKLSSMSSKYLGIHDTKDKYKPELISILKKLIATDEWYVDHHSNADWGFTVLSRSKPEQEVVAWYPEDGPGTELKTILASYGLKATENCGCNTMANQMNLWGPENCLKEDNLTYISKMLEANAKKWFDTSDATWWKKTTIGFSLIKDFVNPSNPYEGLVKLAVNRYNKRKNNA
jgi:glycosyltransferase involved in cell wall biosynthesis